MQYFKKFLKVLMWPIIFFVGQFLIALVVGSIIHAIDSNITPEEFIDKYSYVLAFITFIIFFIILAKKNKQNNHLENKLKIKEMIYIFLIGASMITIYNIVMSNINQIVLFTTFDTKNINILEYIICTAILGPILEELVFRGIVFNELKTFNKQMTSILITSFLFAFFHSTVLQVIYAFALSFMLIYVYQKYKTIIAPILLHIVSNIFNLLSCMLITNNNQIITYSVLVISLITIFIINKKIIKKDL